MVTAVKKVERGLSELGGEGEQVSIEAGTTSLRKRLQSRDCRVAMEGYEGGQGTGIRKTRCPRGCAGRVEVQEEAEWLELGEKEQRRGQGPPARLCREE